MIPNIEWKKPYIYRIPKAFEKKVDEPVVELSEAGLIEESDADVAHQVFFFSKKDGNSRFCEDYRILNAVTKPDIFPVENAVDLMYGIGKANIITTMDLLKG